MVAIRALTTWISRAHGSGRRPVMTNREVPAMWPTALLVVGRLTRRHGTVAAVTVLCLCLLTGLTVLQLITQRAAITATPQYNLPPDYRCPNGALPAQVIPTSLDSRNEHARDGISEPAKPNAEQFAEEHVPPGEPSGSPQHGDDRVTIVTALLDIGEVVKTDKTVRSYDDYLNTYSRPLAQMDNNLVVFVCNAKAAKVFTQLRRLRANQTKVIEVDVTKLQSFSHVDKVRHSFTSYHFPRHLGVTTNPLYTAVMMAKFELMTLVLDRQYFNTSYLAWVDVGLYRTLSGSRVRVPTFRIRPPPGYMQGAIAMDEPRLPDFTNTPFEVLMRGDCWVGAGFFLADQTVMRRFVTTVTSYMELLVSLGIVSTDELAIYGMFSWGVRCHHNLTVQSYRPPPDTADRWFYLGYLAAGLPWSNKGLAPLLH